MGLRVLSIQGKCSTTELHPSHEEHIQTKTCTQIFIGVFIMAKIWSILKNGYSSTDEWINKMWIQ
jgi:hypothetical protein